MIACLGDSITRGSHSPGAATWPAQLAALLGQPVGNFGLDGGDLARIREVWRVQVAGHGWDAVVLLGGINDIISGANGAATWDRQRTLVKDLKAAGLRVVLCALTPFGGWPGATSSMRVAALNVHEEGEPWARANGVIWADTYSPLDDGTGACRAGLSTDGLHLTAEGCGLGAAAVHRALEKAK